MRETRQGRGLCLDTHDVTRLVGEGVYARRSTLTFRVPYDGLPLGGPWATGVALKEG